MTIVAMLWFLITVYNITAALSFNILREVGLFSWSWFPCLFLVLCLFFERPITFTPILTSQWGVSFWSVFLFFTGSAAVVVVVVVVFAFFPFEF